MFVLLRGVHVSYTHGEAVTFRIHDVTPRDARRKPKIYILTKENDKNNCNTQFLE